MAPLTAPAPARGRLPAPGGSTVQRLPFGAGSGRSVGALAAAASAAVASTLGHVRPSPQRPPPPGPPPPYEPAPPYEPPASGGRPAPGAAVAQEEPPPPYTAVPAAAFDPRELTDFQLDELVHRIIDRVTRLVRTELRMDRERIGRLRDPRA